MLLETQNLLSKIIWYQRVFSHTLKLEKFQMEVSHKCQMDRQTLGWNLLVKVSEKVVDPEQSLPQKIIQD